MLAAIDTTLVAAGIDARPQRLAADSGYWSIANVWAISDAPELLIPPARHGRHGKPRKDGKPSESRSDGLRAAMTAKLTSEHGRVCYAQRSRTIEPVSGRSRPSRAVGGSCDGGCGLVRPSGSCCAVPTACSSSGARPQPPPADRHPTPGAVPAILRGMDRLSSSPPRPEQPAAPLGNRLVPVNASGPAVH